MLVLTRRIGQKVHIGDGITVTVVSTGRGRVQLGIDAPREISVRRISESISESCRTASKSESDDEDTIG